MSTETTTETKPDYDSIIGLIAPAAIVVLLVVVAVNTVLGRWSPDKSAEVQAAQETLTTAVSAPPAYTPPTTAAPVVTTPPTTAAPAPTVAPTTAAPAPKKAPVAAPAPKAPANVVTVRGMTFENCPNINPDGVKRVNDFMGPPNPAWSRTQVCG